MYVWRDWFYKIFVPTMKTYCEERNIAFKILLLVDNFNAHPFCDHPNVKMHFLPPNTTSIIQPMDQGAISVMKTNYKYNLLNAALNARGRPTLLEFLKKFDLLDAIYLLEKSWNDVPLSAMQGVWNKLLRSNEFEPEISSKIDEIVHLGQSLGLKDINAEIVREHYGK